jgi:hypothetical protein
MLHACLERSFRVVLCCGRPAVAETSSKMCITAAVNTRAHTKHRSCSSSLISLCKQYPTCWCPLHYLLLAGDR